MFDTPITVVGNVAEEPRMRITKSGHAVTNFRLASTSRRFDTEQGRYADNATLWLTVTCWRALAENVEQSVHKGQPVVVTGRIYCRSYEVNETNRVAYELEATAVGHDLARGKSAFERTWRPAGVQVAVDADGQPADDSDRWLDVVMQAGDPSAPDRSAEPDNPAGPHESSDGQERELVTAS